MQAHVVNEPGSDSEQDPFQAALAAAEAAERVGDIDQAHRHWDHARELCPERVEGYVKAATAALRAYNFDEADRILKVGREQCSDTLRMMIEQAWVPFYKGDHDKAARRWWIIVVQYPWHGAGWVGTSRTLVKLGKYDLAESILHIAARHSPNNSEVVVAFAELAQARQEWPRAVQLWRALKEQYPQLDVQQQLGEALWHLQFEQGGDTSAPAGQPPAVAAGRIDVGTVDDEAARALVMQFEGLGENCEFGLLQRRFGAEPLGLLRWNTTAPETLLKMLESRFEGLGSAETTSLALDPDGEYYVQDTRFDLHLHTFMKQHQVNAEDLLAKQRKRLVRLREMMIEGLTEADKIFVYKTNRADWRDFIEPIHRALRQFGPCTLLAVHLHDADNPPGSVRMAKEGLLHGFLDRMNPMPHGPNPGWDISFDTWLEVLRGARSLVPQRVSVLPAVSAPAPEPLAASGNDAAAPPMSEPSVPAVLSELPEPEPPVLRSLGAWNTLRAEGTLAGIRRPPAKPCSLLHRLFGTRG